MTGDNWPMSYKSLIVQEVARIGFESWKKQEKIENSLIKKREKKYKRGQQASKPFFI